MLFLCFLSWLRRMMASVFWFAILPEDRHDGFALHAPQFYVARSTAHLTFSRGCFVQLAVVARTWHNLAFLDVLILTS